MSPPVLSMYWTICAARAGSAMAMPSAMVAEGLLCPGGRERGAMGGLHGDEFGHVGDQILFEKVRESDVSTD